MTMTEWLFLFIAVVVIAGLAWFLYRWQRHRRMSGRFGPEYERTVETTGSRSAAERTLKEREERVAAFHIHPLDPQDRDRFAADWRRVQARFVDEPGPAVEQADELIRDVMQRRGYPVGDFESRADDLSVHHPVVVQHYRAGGELADRSREGRANTEDLRQAMVHYRALFEELLEDRPARTGKQSGARRRSRTRKGVKVEPTD
jgi:hypothetical protein